MGGNDHRIAQNTRLVALDLGHLRGLLGHRQVLVHDAHAALLGDGDGQPGLGHRVHGGRDQGQIQGDVAGKLGGEGGVLGQDLGVRWHQQHIVEGERFAKKAHVKAPNKRLYLPAFT